MELESHCVSSRLLLVDDSPTNLRFLAHVLHHMGELFFATDGPSALQIARDKQPDLILLDMVLKGTSGEAVLRSLKEHGLTRNIAVMIISAKDALQDEESLFSSQQQGFYRDLYDSQLAMSMVHKGGLGLKEQIVAQMAPTLKNSDNSVAVPQHGSESFRQSLHQVKRKPD